MEIDSKELFSDEIRYQKAKKKARGIRDFYINLSFFCLCMPLIIGINLYYVPEFHWFWFSLTGWGIGLLFHGLSAFEFNPFMRHNWEERKLQQFIKEDLERENLQKDLKK